MACWYHDIQNFVIGDDWPIIGRIQDENGNAIDPTGATNVAWKLNDETFTINYGTLTLGTGIVIGADPEGISSVPVFLITVPNSLTSTLAPNTYWDQLRFTLGLITTVWQGPIQARPQLS